MAKLLITLTLMCLAALTGCKVNINTDAKSSADVDTNAEGKANTDAKADADADTKAETNADSEDEMIAKINAQSEALKQAAEELGPNASLASLNMRAGEIMMEKARAKGDAKADAGTDADADGEHRVKSQREGWGEYVPYWNVARAFELGLFVGYQPALATTDNVESAHVFQTALNAKFLWSYLYGTGFIGPSLRLGQQTTFADDAVTGEGVSNTSFLLQPGFYHGIYIGDAWIFNQNLGLVLPNAHDPGIQADIGVTWVATSVFQLEFGGSVSYLQTNLEADGREANMFTVGPYLNFNFELWGEYKYYRGYDPDYWEELKKAGGGE